MARFERFAKYYTANPKLSGIFHLHELTAPLKLRMNLRSILCSYLYFKKRGTWADIKGVPRTGLNVLHITVFKSSHLSKDLPATPMGLRHTCASYTSTWVVSSRHWRQPAFCSHSASLFKMDILSSAHFNCALSHKKTGQRDHTSDFRNASHLVGGMPGSRPNCVLI